MTTRFTAAAVALLCAAASGQTSRPTTQPATRSATRPATAPVALTPAEALINASKQAAAARPDTVGPYNVLAFAYARRARETGDAAWYAKMDAALADSLRVSPGNFDANKVRALALIAQGKPAAARDLIAPIFKTSPDDLMARGLMSDAQLALGDYPAAETEAQYILDSRPNNPVGLLAAANLREVYGDPDGALELINMALNVTPPNDSEERSRLMAQEARLHLSAGRTDAADAAATAAVQQFPDYYAALAARADVREAQGKFAEAVELRRRVEVLVPTPAHQYALAESLERAGQSAEAADAFAAFAREAAARADGPLNANRLLVLYDVDRADKPAEAFEVAQKEARARPTVYALDALAWANLARGNTDRARRLMDRALAVGVRDATVFRHAAAIAAAAGDRDAASDYLRQAELMTPRPLVGGALRQLEKRIEAMPTTAPATAPATRAAESGTGVPPASADGKE